MRRWSTRDEVPGEAPRCTICKKKPLLSPMRFVVVCGRGHLDDVDWKWWAHSHAVDRESLQCGAKELRFENVRGVGGGLKSIRVRCSVCNASRDLEQIANPLALSGQRCRGGQPWQYPNQREDCDAQPVVLQRGASSVYFPVVGSAIDIPPDSDWAVWGSDHNRILQNRYFKFVQEDPYSDMREDMIDRAASDLGVDRSLVVALLNQVTGGATVSDSPSDLEEGEWRALTMPNAEPDPRDNFIAHNVPFSFSTGTHSEPLIERFGEVISQIVVVDRLREIRALRGFFRHTMEREVPPDLGAGVDFLPAIEVFGEGVFIRLDEASVAAWERQPAVIKRAADIQSRLSASHRARWLKPASPRRLLVHTLGHLLLREVSFEAGYSTSSMRERLYVSEPGSQPMAGVLIYTAAGDSEGSLGGLARLGAANRILPIFASMVLHAEWCSLDPVCSEIPQGPEGLSRAACHACALVPETSCDSGNVLLDRALVIHPEFGFLAPVLEALRSQMVAEAPNA